MSIRTLFLFVFLFVNSFIFISNAATNTSEEVIPSVIVKLNKANYTFTSGPKVVIDKQLLAANGVRNIAQALQNISGIQLRDSLGNGSQATISMRGFGENAASNTLFLVNGIPITNPDMAAPNLNIIPVYAIEAIEVIAGSESVLYGDQAVGGVINVITRSSANERGEVACLAGSYNAAQCYGTIFNKAGRLKYNVGVSANKTDNYRDHNQYEQNYLLSKFDYPYAAGILSLDLNINNEDMQYPGALTAAQVRQNRRQANNNTDFFKSSSGLLHLKDTHYINDAWQLETDLVQRQMHGHGVLFSKFTQSRMIYFVKPTLHANLGRTILKTGLDFQSDNYHLNSAFGPNENNQQKYSVFGVGQYNYTEKLLFTAGMRLAQQHSALESFTDNNNLNRAIATTLGATFQPWESTSFYLRRAENFRFPKADENASTPMGIKSLRTQRGVSYETGMEYLQNIYDVKLNFYELFLRDEIAFDPTQTPQQPFGANRNLSPTVRRGFSISGKYYFNPRLAIDGQYNFVSARFRNGINANNRIPLVAENIVRAGVNYALNEHWQIYAEGIYTGNQYSANDDANVAGLIGGYTTYNFNLRYFYKNFEAALHINNIFNKAYYLYTVYRSTGQNQFFYPAPERNFALMLKYLFQ